MMKKKVICVIYMFNSMIKDNANKKSSSVEYRDVFTLDC